MSASLTQLIRFNDGEQVTGKASRTESTKANYIEFLQMNTTVDRPYRVCVCVCIVWANATHPLPIDNAQWHGLCLLHTKWMRLHYIIQSHFIWEAQFPNRE